MASSKTTLKEYRDLLRQQQLAIARKLVDNPVGADPVTVAIKNAAGFATLQSAIETADDIVAEFDD